MEGLEGAKQILEYGMSIRIPLGTTFDYSLMELIAMSVLISLFFKLAFRERNVQSKSDRYTSNRRDRPSKIDFEINSTSPVERIESKSLKKVD